MNKVQNEDDGALAESNDEKRYKSTNIVDGETSLGDSVIVPEVDIEFKDS